MLLSLDLFLPFPDLVHANSQPAGNLGGRFVAGRREAIRFSFEPSIVLRV